MVENKLGRLLLCLRTSEEALHSAENRRDGDWERVHDAILDHHHSTGEDRFVVSLLDGSGVIVTVSECECCGEICWSTAPVTIQS